MEPDLGTLPQRTRFEDRLSADVATTTALETEAHRRLLLGGRILVTRLRFVGDAIMTLPLLSCLRRVFPKSEIHYLAEAPALDLLREEPQIDVRWESKRGVRATLGLGWALRRTRFDAAIDLLSNPRSALLVRMCGAPVRIGEARSVRARCYTRARRLVPGRSALQQHLDALRGVGVLPPAPDRPVLHLRDEERSRGRNLWESVTNHRSPGVLLHLGASQRAKEWPAEKAVEFVQQMVGGGDEVVLSTAPNRPEPSHEVATHAGVPRLPILGLRDMLGVVDQARLVVSVDGAMAHAAIALGRPTLVLLGPTDPGIWFPYDAFGPYRVLHAGHDCRSCDRVFCPTRACMSALDPETVLAGARRLLADGPQEVPR